VEERVFTKEELAAFDGKEGKPAYVAWNGSVYDVSDSVMWENGEHIDEHAAGNDLTQEIEDLSPHGTELLEAFPVVGTLSD